MKEFTVDFNNEDPTGDETLDTVFINPDKFTLYSDSKFPILNWFSKKVRLSSLKIECKKNMEIILKDPSADLLYFEWEGVSASEINDIIFGNKGVEIFIKINVANIKDFEGENNSTIINYRILTWEHNKNKEEEFSNVQMTLFFKPEKNSTIVIDDVRILENEIVSKIEKQQKKIAAIKVRNTLRHSHSIPVYGWLNVEANDRQFGRYLEFENESNSIELKRMRYNETREFFLFVNYNNLPGVKKENSIKYRYNLLDSNQKQLSQQPSSEYNLLIKPDPRSKITDLEFAIEHAGEELIELFDSNKSQNISTKIPKPILWTPLSPTTQRQLSILKFRIGNRAKIKSDSGVVHVRDVSISIDCKDRDKIRLLNIVKELNDLLIYKKIQSVEFKNGDPSIEIELNLASNLIGQDSANELNFIILFQMTYDIEQTVASESRIDSMLTVAIDFSLKKRITHWLAIDFGTSAISAAFASDDFNISESRHSILDIREEHINRLVREMGGKKELYNISEMDTPYLPSTMLLNVETSDDGTDILKPSIVKLSPREDDPDHGRIESILPPLKLLIGYDNIPTFKNYFRYTDNLGNLTIGPLPVDMVLSKAYEQLITKTIIPLIIKRISTHAQNQLNRYKFLNKVGKLVLTVPNTFGDIQKEVIYNLLAREITWEKLKLFEEESPAQKGPLFKKDTILFVSESDSVACYYYHNWENLNHSAIIDRKNIEFPKQEYVLVYDLGAGTLDITYILIKRNVETTRLEYVEVLGRIGSKRAGHAFDTFLAKVLLKRAIDSGEVNFSNQIVFSKSLKTGIEKRNNFKKFVQLLKRELGQIWDNTDNKELMIIKKFREKYSGDLPISDATLDGIPLSFFKNNKIIKKFIDFSTRYVLEQFIENLKSSSQIDDLQVDTIIFSGRGSQFPEIRSKTINYIKNTRSNINKLNIVTLTENELKDAVVLGALTYATRFAYNPDIFRDKAITARYGILYRIGMKSMFCELLGPGEQLDFEKINGNNLYETEIFHLDFSDDPVIRFVQTYHANPDIDDWQMTSEIFEISVEEALGGGQYSRDKLPVKLTIDLNKRLMLSAGIVRTEPQQIERIGLKPDIILEESSWPNCEPQKLRKEMENLISGSQSKT